MFPVDRLNEDLYNPGSANSSSVDPDPMGYFDRIKESDNPVVGAVREYWDSVLSFAAGYLFSEVSAFMLVGGAIVEYMGRKDGRTLAKEYTSPFEAYLSENINRFVRNGLLLPSGLFLADPKPEYIGVGLLLGGIAYACHRGHKSAERKRIESETVEDEAVESESS